MSELHSESDPRGVDDSNRWRSVSWWTLLAAAVVVRIAVAAVWADRSPVIVDAKDYDGLATSLVETGAFASPSGELTSLRPPLYPAVVALIYQLFGAHNYFAVAVLQSLVSLVTMELTYRLGAAVYGPPVGRIATAVAAFYPSLLAFNCLLLSETLFTCFYTACTLASVRLLSKPNWRDAVALGLFLGLGALTRSILYLCAVPVAGYLVLFACYPVARRLALASLSIAVFAAILAPWAYRNTQLQQTFTLVDVMGGRNVMMGNYEHTPLERSWATITDVTGDQAWHRILAADTPDYASLTQGQIDKRAMAYGLRYFFTHPKQSAQRCLVRFFNFWQLDRTIVAGLQQGVFGRHSQGFVLAMAVLFTGGYAATLLAAIGGLFIAPPPWRANLLLLLWIAIPCAIHTAAFAHSRYHLPLIPLLAVYAAAAVAALLAQPRLIFTRRAALAGATFAVFVVAWARELVMVDLHWFAS